MILSKEQIKALIEGVWSGEYGRYNLPEWLYTLLGAELVKAVEEGWGNALGKGAMKDLALEAAMKDNVFYFAAHKTAQELNDLNNILLVSKGKYDFTKNALAVNEKYNKHWFDTEYNVSRRLAKAGREWIRIEESQDVYPYLEFVTVGDENTRASHAALNGIIKPVGDAFWTMYFPPLDWNCRCRVVRRMEGEPTNTDEMKLPEVQEQFAQRVTDSRKIWHESHPYFDVSKKQKEAIDKMIKKVEDNGKENG